MSSVLFIVGKVTPEGWEFSGVFDTPALADFACRDCDYFYAPAQLNHVLPHERQEWPGCIWPRCVERDALAAAEEV